MSEDGARPSATRGRGSTRASRGGFSSRGGLRQSAKQTNGEDSVSAPEVSLEEQGELGQLKMRYSSQLETLKELFPDWTDDDLVFALQETDGDIQSTIERITEGSVSRFADVKKKSKEKKSKDVFMGSDSQAVSSRGRSGRGGYEGTRGGRGRGSERGRGGSRGGRGGAAFGSGARAPSTSIIAPGVESGAWGSSTEDATTSGAADVSADNPDVPGAWPTSTDNATGGWDEPATGTVAENSAGGQWGSGVSTETSTAAASGTAKSSLIPEGSKKSWASMLAQAKLPILAPKAAPPPAAEPEPSVSEDTASGQAPTLEDSEAVPTPPILEENCPVDQSSVGEERAATAYQDENEAATHLDPPADQLTEDNVERLPDASAPVATETAASTVDATSVVGTPYGSTQQVPTLGRPPLGGYATSAWKAAGIPGRSSSFQRMMEQREAVVMPGNHAVDRAAVQFGQMGLNGDSKPVDVDEDREDAETRAQPPQQSPPPQPKTSLPPAYQQSTGAAEQLVSHDGMSALQQAPGLPPPSQTPLTSASSQQPPQMPPGITQPGLHGAQSYGQYGRYSADTMAQEASLPAQKPYDPFSQQLGYPQGQTETHATSQGQLQQQSQSQHGGFAHNQGDYGNPQYGGEQQRTAFQGYYGGSYGQQPGPSQQENLPPQRTTSGFGAHDSGFGATQTTQSQSRFGESTPSEQTPSGPTMSSQQQQSGPQSQHGQPAHQQGQGQPGQGSAYPYNNPYYGSSYYGSYMNQYPNYQYNQQGYGGGYGGKGGMYGQMQHGYGMSPQSSYEHSTTPGASSALSGSSIQGRDSSFGAGMSEYGRSASTQAQSQQHSSTYGSYPSEHLESFGRSPMNTYSQQQNDTTLKPFQDQKPGASPSLGPPGRTGSAANSTGYGGMQSSYPPPQSQSGFGGYPSHMNQLHNNHGSQYGGFGGLGGQGTAQSHQAGYGNYGGTYGNYSGRGGWGGGH